MFNEPSVNITGVQRFNNFGDVQRRGGDSHGPTEFRQQQGDWSHTEQ